MKKVFTILMSLMLMAVFTLTVFADSQAYEKYFNRTQLSEIQGIACQSAEDKAKCDAFVVDFLNAILSGRVASYSASADITTAMTLAMNVDSNYGLKVTQSYEFWAYDKDGKLKWHDTIPHNLVMTEGLNKYLDCTLKTGSCTPTLYMGLVTGPGSGTTYALGDTIAVHAGWTENTDYTGNRKAVTLGTISGGSVDNSASKASFAINGSATIAGAFVCSAETGTSGTMYGGADFTGGDRSVISGDTVQGQVTFSIANP